jgi:arginine utilization regulatory protein
MPVSLQNKLLRVLQEKKVRRIGEGHERAIDVRIVSSVGRNPMLLVDDGLLRQDFYYRLGVVKIYIPPLRSRMEDIHSLVQHFLQLHSDRLGVATPLITPEAMAVFYAHSWPGNVRELEHAIEASLNLVEPGDNLEPWHLYHAVPDFIPIHHPKEDTTPWLAFQDRQEALPPGTANGRSRENPGNSAYQAESGGHPAGCGWHTAQAAGTNLEAKTGLFAQTRAVEAVSIENSLRVSAGNVTMAARLLGISPQLLHYKMKKYAIDKREFMPISP